jgi:hypothetical protein
MTFIMSIDDWKAGTYSRVYSRSTELKAIDAAIQACNNTDDADVDTVMTAFAQLGQRSEQAQIVLQLQEAQQKLALKGLIKAFNTWATKETRSGHAWRSSSRNSNGTVGTLHSQMVYWDKKFKGTTARQLEAMERPERDAVTTAEAAEREALAALIEARNNSIPLMFRPPSTAGCKVLAIGDIDKNNLNNLKMKATVAKSGAQSARGIAQLSGVTLPSVSTPSVSSPSTGHSALSSAVGGLVKDQFGVAMDAIQWDVAETFLRDALLSAVDSIKSEIMSVVPVLGLITSGGKVVFDTIKLVLEGITADELVKLTNRLERSDPRKALEAVQTWQKLEIAKRTSSLARNSATFGSQLAGALTGGLAVPAQVAVSTATALLALAEVIGDIALQYKQSRALTAYLNNTTTPPNADIFAISPLAAAYYLLNTPDSHIALQLVAIGEPGWQADVEMMKKDGEILLAQAQAARIIEGSRYRIKPPVGRYRERCDKSLSDKAKAKLGIGQETHRTMESISSSS